METRLGTNHTPPLATHTISKYGVLYQNERKDVTLIDIPRSIEAAQGSRRQLGQLLSCAALEKPFPSNEPKSDAARAKLEKQSSKDRDTDYSAVIDAALTCINVAHKGEWCLLRAVDEPNVPRKRKADDNQEAEQSTQRSLSDLLATLSYHGSIGAPMKIKSSDDDGSVVAFDIEWSPSFYNDASETIEVTIAPDGFGVAKFWVPSESHYYMADCSLSSDFHAAVRKHAEEWETPRRFDFILLDPPWPNRSVKRTHKTGQSSYKVASSLQDLKRMILKMDIDVLIAPGGLIGVWITNKPAVREAVLGDNGLFAAWGIELQEEWIWVKVTKLGEPVTILDAMWRKPYEILLLGRKKAYGGSTRHATVGNAEATGIRQRVIAGVPDLHSRKPCLKELIEPLMADPSEYRALEIFARYLVAGWWSWGNEVLRFNHESCWK